MDTCAGVSEHITLFPNIPFGKSFAFFGDLGRVLLFISTHTIVSQITKLQVIYTGKVNLKTFPGKVLSSFANIPFFRKILDQED